MTRRRDKGLPHRSGGPFGVWITDGHEAEAEAEERQERPSRIGTFMLRILGFRGKVAPAKARRPCTPRTNMRSTRPSTDGGRQRIGSDDGRRGTSGELRVVVRRRDLAVLVVELVVGHRHDDAPLLAHRAALVALEAEAHGLDG